MKQVRDFLAAADDCFEAFVRARHVEESVAPTLRALALRDSFDAFVRHWSGSAPASAAALEEAWNRAAEMLGLRAARLPLAKHAARRVPPVLETVEVFEVAVAAHLSSLVSSHEGRATIRRLMAQLQISYDDVGRALGVDGETVRRWDQGAYAIAPEKHALLSAANTALSRFLQMFLPHALPTVIRTPAEIFGGERAIDWILRGRIADVAAAYDAALLYQA